MRKCPACGGFRSTEPLMFDGDAKLKTSSGIEVSLEVCLYCGCISLQDPRESYDAS